MKLLKNKIKNVLDEKEKDHRKYSEVILAYIFQSIRIYDLRVWLSELIDFLPSSCLWREQTD